MYLALGIFLSRKIPNLSTNSVLSQQKLASTFASLFGFNLIKIKINIQPNMTYDRLTITSKKEITI